MAKEYIEREALCNVVNIRLKNLRNEYGDYDHYTDGFDECVDCIKIFPTADVVEVVRCRDCKHYDPYNRQCDHAHGMVNALLEGDGFCSYGEEEDVK